MSQQAASRKMSLNWDVLAGALIMGIGAAFLYFGWNLRAGTLGRMGPGYLPLSVSMIMMALGAVIALQGFGKTNESVHWPALRPFVVVVMSPILFALLIGRLGLVLTILVVASLGRLAQRQPFGIEAVLMPVLLAVFCVIVFTYLLGLPIPLWP